MLARLATTTWLAAGRGRARRFHDAFADPAGVQWHWLQRRLRADTDSAFGRAYAFSGIRTYADFARRVPLTTWEDTARWVARIQRGERRVLTTDAVSHLVPTSGSTGARKLIPFTRTLGRAFDAAVAAWLRDLAQQRPDITHGPAYWAISPLAESGDDADSAVPVGFADDASYLGGARAWLVRQALAVPASARLVPDEQAFWGLTALALLRCRNLRLISIWHPSFLELLVEAATASWPELLDAIAHGTNPWLDAVPSPSRREWRARRDPARAAELRRLGSGDWPRWWPWLSVVSCWGEQAAEGGWRRLASRLPSVLVQRKGLLATEAVVTIPIGDVFPLAVTSHFFEFLDGAGEIRRAHELEPGRQYEVIVTNGGGLWRYRLGDVVECTGHLAATPTLRFLGRVGVVSDLRGEKLAEPFVAEALRSLWEGEMPEVATLRAYEQHGQAGYELLVSGDRAGEPDELALRLDRALQANPHYALARR
ncbi:MAG TPA: GH3 auxin-responsive promoter family protein, partial [Gemmatimonadaceae bacterium]